MALFRQKLTEPEAAAHFTRHMMETAQAIWPKVKTTIQQFDDGISFEEERFATFDLALAAIAVHLQALHNLFPRTQAERTHQWVLKTLDSPEYGEYATDAVDSYCSAWQEAASDRRNPLDDVAGMLVVRWLGQDTERVTVQVGDKRVINPVVLLVVQQALVEFGAFWKEIQKDYKLIEGDLPLDETEGLRDFTPEPLPHSDCSTIQIRDAEGKYHERAISPEQLNLLLNTDVTKRVCKILVKGSWQGIKEMYRELSDEDEKKFADPTLGCAYAICKYERGEAKFMLVTKHIWERWEQAVTIMEDSRLSPSERQRQLQAFFAQK